MILAGFLVAFVLGLSAANEGSSDEEIPFVVASQGSLQEGQGDSLAGDAQEKPASSDFGGLDQRGRSDIEIEEDKPFGGYFYPKPSKPFYLPPFKALGAEGATQFAEEEGAEVDRPQRSPQRWRPQYQTPPTFIPGFIPPNPIRPLPGSGIRPLPASGIRPLPASGIRPLPAPWNGRPVGY